MSQDMLNCVLKDYRQHVVQTITRSNNSMIKGYVKSLVKCTIDEFLLSLIHRDSNNRRYLSSSCGDTNCNKRYKDDPFKKYEENDLDIFKFLFFQQERLVRKI